MRDSRALALDELNSAFSKTVLGKTLTLKAKDLFDYETRVTCDDGFLANYYVKHVEAVLPSTVICLRYADYAKFSNNVIKTTENIQQLVIEKLPGLEFKGHNRRRIVMEQFKEIVSNCDYPLIFDLTFYS